MPEIYHEGELAVQTTAGVSAQAQRVGRIISPYLPDGADGFFKNLPILFRGAADHAGCVWALALTGNPGFTRAIDSRTVEINTSPTPGDPPKPIQVPDGPAGFLAIDMATRQRFRFNGQTARSGDTLHVSVDQAYGNCPKYIQLREVTVHGSAGQAVDGPTATAETALTDTDKDLIRRADTFFIASIADGHGADVSHRGGWPGFVQVTPRGGIAFKDYIGNNMFQTLGNLTADPRAGLLFIDFETGSTLQLTGRAMVNWASDQPADRAETGRSVTFQPKQVVRTPYAIPLRWVLRAYSPYNPDENSH